MDWQEQMQSVLADAIHKAIVKDAYRGIDVEPHPAFLEPDSDQAAMGRRIAEEVMPALTPTVETVVRRERAATRAEGVQTGIRRVLRQVKGLADRHWTSGTVTCVDLHALIDSFDQATISAQGDIDLATTIDVLRAQLGEMEGRALAAEAAREGYRQEAEAGRESYRIANEQMAQAQERIARATALADEWEREYPTGKEPWFARDLRAALKEEP